MPSDHFASAAILLTEIDPAPGKLGVSCEPR
jgi:hypothetical protein